MALPKFIQDILQIDKQGAIKLATGVADAALGPVIDVGKRSGAGLFEILRMIDAQEHGQVDPRYAAKNPFMSEQRLTEMSDPGIAALRTAQTSAGLASYAIPGGKFTAPVASKAAVRQLANISLRGGARLALLEASRPDADVDSVPQAFMYGAATAPAFALGGRGLKHLRGYTPEVPTQNVDYVEVGGRGIPEPAATIDPRTNETVFTPKNSQAGFMKLGSSPKGEVVYRAVDSNTGRGVLGKGTYFDVSKDAVARYGKDIKKFILDPKAKMLDLTDPAELDRFTDMAFKANFETFSDVASKQGQDAAWSEIMSKTAMELGFDGIRSVSKVFGSVVFNSNLLSPK